MNQPTTQLYHKAYKILGIIVFAGFILYAGKPLLIPLSFALFISFILQPICSGLEKKGVNRIVAISSGILVIFAILLLLIYLLYTQFINFIHEWPAISIKIAAALDQFRIFLTDQMGFSRQQVDFWLVDITNSTANDIVNMLQATLVSTVINFVMILLIPIYAFLILLYRQKLVEVLYSIFPAKDRSKVAEVVGLSINTYYNFIKGMAVVYLVVGILNSIGLFLLGVPHAFLFGFMTAIMTFIPYVGIIVASLLPISYAWITYNSIWYPLGVVGVFTFVQYLEANIIFPWAVSQRLQLNTLVTLIIIVLGGILWGGPGMILFIPFAAILKLIADRMEGWESLAKILGN